VSDQIDIVPLQLRRQLKLMPAPEILTISADEYTGRPNANALVHGLNAEKLIPNIKERVAKRKK